VAECAGPNGTFVPALAQAHDLCSPVAQVTNDRTANGADGSGLYPLGTTAVAFTSTDAAGNVATWESSILILANRRPSPVTLPRYRPERAGPPIARRFPQNLVVTGPF